MKTLFLTQSYCLIILLIAFQFSAGAQPRRLIKKASKASAEFAQKASEHTDYKFKADTVIVNPETRNITLKMKEDFSYIPFRVENVKQYNQDFVHLLGRKFRKYKVSIETMGKEIQELIPNLYRDQSIAVDAKRLSQTSKSKLPIVRNISANTHFTEGLTNQNIALWHSHGWYYENTLDRWEWQRARVFLTVEDIWTMSFVVPYLAPMLENAGAHVFLPRERDIQQHEIIIDADGSTQGSAYSETGSGFQDGKALGFGLKVPFLLEGENPFQMGQTRKIQAQKTTNATIIYTPEIPETGDYAVYVSYSPNDENVTDAHYTVYHSGGKTDFWVNQTMGGGTWIYLGTFRFEKGKEGRIELNNQSNETGQWVSADAVKLGGGIGNVARGKAEEMDRLRQIRDEKGFAMDSALWLPYISQRPKYQEAARYYLQSAGMPDTLVYLLNKTKTNYSNRGKDAAAFAKREEGKDDYKDDYQSRGEW